MTGKGKGTQQTDLDLLITYGRCETCGSPRSTRLYHDGIEYTGDALTIRDAMKIGGEWRLTLTCKNGHQQP